jgi:hypothetical protein
MVTNQGLGNKFNWGDDVKILRNFLQSCNIASGSICGIRKLENEENPFLMPVGTIIYLVESRNGESTEIPEPFLDKL